MSVATEAIVLRRAGDRPAVTPSWAKAIASARPTSTDQRERIVAQALAAGVGTGVTEAIARGLRAVASSGSLLAPAGGSLTPRSLQSCMRPRGEACSAQIGAAGSSAFSWLR